MYNKERITRKEIFTAFKHRICIPYCGLQRMLSYRTPDYYTVRREGWAADIYVLSDDTCIVTGYAPFGEIKPSYNEYSVFEIAANDIICQHKYGDVYNRLEELISHFELYMIYERSVK